MISCTLKLVVLSTLAGVAMVAQDLPMIVKESYTGDPPTITVAPGQIVTLYVRGLNVPPAVSKSDPLARELSGVYVLLEDGNNNWSQKLPLMRIGTGGCSTVWQGTCPDTNIVAQIPYDMPYGTLQRPPYPRLTVYKNGKPGFTETVVYTSAVPRILSSCVAALIDDWPPSRTGGCRPMVTRQDGSLVSNENPFVAGEIITIYAWGLGATDPLVEAGTAVTQLARTLARYRVRVCYNCGGLPEGGFYSAVGPWFDPEYVGLTVGSAGLYQINIKTPPPPPEALVRFPGPIGRAVFYFSSSVSSEFSIFGDFRSN